MPLHYIEKGNKEATPVVFIHGFPFSLEMWKEQIDVVAEKQRAIAYDLRGYGKSPVGEGTHTIEEHVDDLITLLNDLKIQKAVIAGLSMGGYIALRALEREPERFRAAVLCDTKSEADSNEDKFNRFKTIREIKNTGPKIFAEDFLKKVFAEETFKTNPDAVEMIRNIILVTSPLSLTGTLLALAARTDTTKSLFNIKIPALIMVGEKDVITPPANARALHEKIFGSDLHVIPNAGHLSNLENPEAFNQALLTFLSNLA